MLFKINNLDYQINDKIFFQDFNLEISKGEYVSLIGPNGCGKTMLTKIICAIFPTFDKCVLDEIPLNKENVLKYITKIGIASNDFNNPFIFKKVKQELTYPLKNLGYSSYKINNIIAKTIDFFKIEDILNKNIEVLSKSEKSKLQIIISLIHNPLLLVLDDIFNNMNSSDKKFMLLKLKELNEKGLTILNITSKLDTIYDSSKVIIMNNFKIEKINTLFDTFKNDTYLNKIGLEIPYIIDLSLKLINYKLIDKIYFDNKELESNLWK